MRQTGFYEKARKTKRLSKMMVILLFPNLYMKEQCDGVYGVRRRTEFLIIQDCTLNADLTKTQHLLLSYFLEFSPFMVPSLFLIQLKLHSYICQVGIWNMIVKKRENLLRARFLNANIRKEGFSGKKIKNMLRTYQGFEKD